MTPRRRCLVLLGTTLALTSACQRDKTEPAGDTGAVASAPSNAKASPGATAAAKKPATTQGPLGNPTAVGPALEVIPGRGIGPIRFGATFATVERHMENPCDVRTETQCIYTKQAVEFTMKDGVVDGIQVHRRDRVAGKTPGGEPLYYGSYFGGLPPKIVLGIHKHVAVEELRPAEKVEALDPPNEHGTVERHHYPGLVLDYDRLPNGNTVLAGFRILKDPKAESPALAQTGAAAEGNAPAAKP